MESSGDHQVEYEPGVVIEADCYAFTDAADFAHGAAFGVGDGGLDRAKQEGVGEAYAFERVAEDARLEGAWV